jgi:protein SYS1
LEGRKREMFYPKEKWDPLLIIAQIIALQALYYFIYGALVVLADALSSLVPSIEQLFNASILSIQTLSGLVTIISFIITSVLM